MPHGVLGAEAAGRGEKSLNRRTDASDPVLTNWSVRLLAGFSEVKTCVLTNWLVSLVASPLRRSAARIPGSERARRAPITQAEAP